MLQAEIRDETDTWQQEDGGSRRGPRRVELERYLSMFEHKIAAAKALSPQEIQAIASFLSASVQEFAGLASSNVALKVTAPFGLPSLPPPGTGLVLQRAVVCRLQMARALNIFGFFNNVIEVCCQPPYT